MELLFLRAILLQFTGTVGAGIFSLPYALYNSNFLISSLLLIFFGFLVALVNRFYLDVILATPGDHQLPGYCGIYLGRRFRLLAILNIFLLAFGALSAYLRLSSSFLHSFFPRLDPTVATLLYFAVVSAFFLLRSRTFGLIKHLLPLLVIFIPLLLLFFALRLPLPPIADSSFSLAFLGPVFFALSGFTVIPEVEEVLRPAKRPHLVRYAVFFGILLAVAVYIIFSFAIIKLSGSYVSSDSITGILHFSPLLAALLSFLGLISIFNASLNFLNILKEVFYRDLHLPHNYSYLLALVLPLICLFATRISFLELISLTGSVTIFISVLLICLLRFRLNPSFKVRLPLYLTLVFFTFGLLAGLFL